MEQEQRPPSLLVGCCGWPQARSRYFHTFPIVELQETFYDPPSLERARKLRQEAPPGFSFSLKSWQVVTHPATSPTYRRLRRPLSAEEAAQAGFFRPTEAVWRAWQRTQEVAEALDARAVVFQCPPSFVPQEENVENLRRFFGAMQRGRWLLAWEPRGRWPPELVASLCRELGLVHVVDPFQGRPAWGQYAYFRLHGRGGYRYRYSDEELAQLLAICREELELGRRPVYVLFNNTQMGEDAARFLSLARREGLA
ncbi:MAG TPA: DUF72 domain-containing protein [Dehalococcoidia bacterium]|nr:DUF72 domain-containing protein [Dehalococcoidia bacterium]